MIINELDKCIIIDEIRENASASEIYFVSSLLGYETLCLPENWAGRIYTAKFIYEILTKKKPKISPKCLRVLKANVPEKFKSKDKLIYVTMFEPKEIKTSVMFHFDDTVNTFLYIKAFNELSTCYTNKLFSEYVKKGINYVFMDITLSKSITYISTDDTIEEIKNISMKHESSKVALILPNFGYEKLLVEFVKAFPKIFYPTKTQRYILGQLGYKDSLSENLEECRFISLIPGIPTENLETDVITIYITVGDASPLDNLNGTYMRQWSPLLSLMDQQMLLETIKPNYLLPTNNNAFLKKSSLPFSLRWFCKEKFNEEFNLQPGDENSTVTWPDDISNQDAEETPFVGQRTGNNSPVVSSLPSTKIFERVEVFSKKEEVSKCDKVDKQSALTQQTINLAKQRTRVVPKSNTFYFTDSSDDFEIEKFT